MDEHLSKSDFIERCFRERLDDGQPHSYRDILDYIRGQAVGTVYEGTIEQNNAVLSFKKCIELPDSPYGRVRHGVYQKAAPSVLRDRKLCKHLEKLHALLDRSLTLQKEMEALHANCCAEWPDAEEAFNAVWNSTNKNLDASIDCLTAWIADVEDLEMKYQKETDTLSMEMQM